MKTRMKKPNPLRRMVQTAAGASAAAVALVLALSGCGGSAAASPGVLKIAMTSSDVPFTGLYPDNGYEGFRFVANNLYDGLTRLNLDQADTLPTPQPSLASSFEPNADMTAWTFHLRKDVKFTDGTPFNADAVIFKLKSVTDKTFQYYDADVAARGAASFKYIKAFRKLDDSTIQVDTTRPYAYLPWDATAWFVGSPTAIQKLGVKEFPKAPVGTGPFTLKSLTPGQQAVLAKNPDYWGGPAKISEIDLFPAPEAATRLSMLQSGTVNWAEAPSPDAIQQLKSDGFQVQLAKYPHAIAPRFNLFRAPFKDNLKLREALNYALDRDGTAALIGGAGYASSQYVYKGHPDYVDGLTGFSYDKAKAEQLLAEAGYPGGKGLKPLVFAYAQGGSGNMYPDVMMTKLQQDFAAIGVKVELQPMEWNTILTIGVTGLNADQYKNIDILWASPAAGMMPTGYTATFMCDRVPATASTPAVPNAAGMCDPKVDDALNAAFATKDEKGQHALIQQALKTAEDKADFLYWMHDLNLRVMAPSVKGYIPVQSWWLDFTKYEVG